ncbi:HAD family hydrolase [Thermomicrobium sp. 4228-Ro]|uniref:HAD family hydrolase n=1 Tax=Thermomicrobium sp. 4228-Ro TaxID=2993937 RepID=UPI002248EC26|nr:HAD family hydrolase [Thermomicrobium sp. 4228-Ro]MCX2727207.1 HAD family hydrolase [Thermomicrobium sp. 4228-Ro]
MPIRLILFDLDDTLCDHARSFRLRVERAIRAIPPEYVQLPVETIVEFALSQPSHTWEAVRVALERAGVREQALLERALAAYSSDRYYGLELFPDSVPVVWALQQRVLTGLVTNGPSEIQRAKLERLGIARLFPIVIVSEEVGVAKPEATIFHLALARAGMRPEETLFIGDHPVNDVAGAARAGLVSVWCNRSGREWNGELPPAVTVRSLWELYRLVEAWASGSMPEPQPWRATVRGTD